MKFKLEHILLPLLVLVLSSFIKFQDQNKSNDETGFSKMCLKISNEYKTQNEQGHIFNNKTKKFLSLSEFSKILKTVSKYDLNKNAKYGVSQSVIGKIKRIIWRNKENNANLISIEKSTFKTNIEQEFSGGKVKNEFEIVDYLITRNQKPKKIYLRIIETEFEEITIDDAKYTGFFESRLLGIDEAKDEFDKLLNKK